MKKKLELNNDFPNNNLISNKNSNISYLLKYWLSKGKCHVSECFRKYPHSEKLTGKVNNNPNQK